VAKSNRLLRYKQLKPEKGIDYTQAHIREMVRHERFPAPQHFEGSRFIYWFEWQIDEWIAARLRKVEYKPPVKKAG
jgi:predicted DNA-binding transcriptional regulator AlpA